MLLLFGPIYVGDDIIRAERFIPVRLPACGGALKAVKLPSSGFCLYLVPVSSYSTDLPDTENRLIAPLHSA
jgi:hypothetical protein